MAGGIYEGKWLGGGLSHLLEHLVAGGSNERRTEAQNRDLLQKIGNNSNADTAEDRTEYFINTTTDHLDAAVDLVTGWMLTAKITEAEFEREREVVQRELEMGQGEPDRQLYYMYRTNRYRVNPVRVPVICVPTAPPVRARAGAAPTLPRILTVIAPTDLSAVGNAAVPHAYALLRATGGVVELCHVHEHGVPNPAFAYDLPERLSTAERAAIVEQLRALVPAEAEALGITTHVSVIDGGKPAETIVAAAERLNVDAISLGSHGRGGVAHAVMGSVAEAVVRHARRPVLIVPARSG